MLIIRHRSHTRRSAYLLGGAATVALLAVFVLVFAPTLVGPRVWPFALVGALVALKAILPDAMRYLSGDLGERKALAVLRELPDDYVAVTNFAVPDARRGDIDLLVIGPMGIVVAEVKAYSGTIAYMDGAWWRVQPNGWKRPVKNVSAQARGNLRAVTGYIQRQRAGDPALADLFVPVTAALVFVGTERLNTVNLDIPALKVEAIADYVRGLPPRLTGAQVKALAARFSFGLMVEC